jgi:YgiT-type zinc finger domain-containing protein
MNTRKCPLPGCPGTEELKPQVYTARRKGQLIVFRNVPAWVCNFCGETVFALETSRRLEQLIEAPGQPVGLVPLYEFSPAPQEAEGATRET